MPRGVAIASILFIVALSIGLVIENPRYVFAVAAMSVFGFLVVGFFQFPKLKAVLPFRLGPVNKSEDHSLLVAGIEVPPSEFPQHFVCILQLRSMPLLIALTLVSLAAFCLLVSSVPLAWLLSHYELLGIYLPALLTVFALGVSIKWYGEQTLLGRSIVTLGSVTGVDDGGRHRRIRYEFRDANGDFYGGSERDLLAERIDHLVFVMYDLNNPDNNSSSRGFMFRSFKVYSVREGAQEA